MPPILVRALFPVFPLPVPLPDIVDQSPTVIVVAAVLRIV
jgi:hypothetical protein